MSNFTFLQLATSVISIFALPHTQHILYTPILGLLRRENTKFPFMFQESYVHFLVCPLCLRVTHAPTYYKCIFKQFLSNNHFSCDVAMKITCVGLELNYTLPLDIMAQFFSIHLIFRLLNLKYQYIYEAE